MARCDSYDFGQCTAGACALAPWVEDGWGNAGDWAAAAAAAGFGETLVPTVGAIVVYRPSSLYSSFGHVAYVDQVFSLWSYLVTEMNYAAWDQYDQRVSNMQDVAAFILPPGVQPGPGGTGGGQGSGGSVDGVRAQWVGLQEMLNAGLPQLWFRAVRARQLADTI